MAMNKINSIGTVDMGSKALREAAKFIADGLLPNSSVGTCKKGINCFSFARDVVVNMIDRGESKELLCNDSLESFVTI